MKRLILYIIRWQLSTPILAICVDKLSDLGTMWATIIANLIGALIFFIPDRYIFNHNKNKNKDYGQKITKGDR